MHEKEIATSAYGRKLPFKMAVFNLIGCPVSVKADIQLVLGERSANDPKQTLFGAVRLLSPRSLRAISTTKITNWEDIGEIIGIAASAESLIIVV